MTTSTKATTAAPTTGPWPKNLTPVQIASAKAAIAAYVGYYKVTDQAFTAPGNNWTAAIEKYAANPAASNDIVYLKQTAARGQYGTGATKVSPVVTKVESGLVSITDCVDIAATDFLNATGKSIKAPNAPGSYFRHVSKVQVAEYVGHRWLVTFITDDWTKTC